MKKIIQILVSVILIVILFFWIDFEELKSSLVSFKYEYAVIAILIITFNRFLMGFKWNLLLKTKGVNISLFAVTKIYYIGNFLGLFLPPTLGTDVVRAFYVSKYGALRTDIISSIIMERLLGFVGLFISALVGFILFINIISTDTFDAGKLFTIIGVLCVISIIGFLLSLNQKINNLVAKFLKNKEEKKYWKKIVPSALKLYDSYVVHKEFKSVLIIFLFLTFAEIFTVVLWSYTIALGLNSNVPLTYFLAFIPLLLFFVRLPISFDGFGINEGFYVYFLALIGIHAATGFSVGIINHFITMVGILPGGLFYAFNKNFKDLNTFEDATITKNLEGTILSWNSGAERLYGYSSQKIIGENISVIIPEEKLQEREEYIKRIAQGENIKLKTERIRKDGSRFNILLSLSPVKDSNGNITEASTIERDITPKGIEIKKSVKNTLVKSYIAISKEKSRSYRSFPP